MKKVFHSLVFMVANFRDFNSIKDFANFVRRVNMELQSNGFRGNKGLTDDFFSTRKEFVWIFDSKDKRDMALKRLRAIFNNMILSTMKTTTTMSSSRATKRKSIRSPRLSVTSEPKWQRMVSRFV
ncbi:Uncharacterised protein [Serratia proteamaculans]|uniref:hypothetical protein n=1 Tax=Serratia proteamaculans TaxID=28151 RepID=UPI00218265DC|nr:hypothetical protein [Serratia proteamaculans]CAI2514831.1 Uncharacterised protein [Serratia proteamaculans]